MSLCDSVDAALCVGWIDVVRRRPGRRELHDPVHGSAARGNIWSGRDASPRSRALSQAGYDARCSGPVLEGARADRSRLLLPQQGGEKKKRRPRTSTTD